MRVRSQIEVGTLTIQAMVSGLLLKCSVDVKATGAWKQMSLKLVWVALKKSF